MKKIIGFLILLSIFVPSNFYPQTVSAEGFSDVTSQILVLSRNLLAQVTSSAPLKMGSSGPTVKLLQTFLSQNKDMAYPKDSITGYYGEITRSVIKNFQQKNNIPVTGIADATTVSLVLTSSMVRGDIKKSSSSTNATSTPPTQPPYPDWCKPPNGYIPINPPNLGAPGLCIKPITDDQTLEKNRNRIDVCFKIHGEIICYQIKIKCSTTNKPCDFKIISPIILPGITCTNLPPAPNDPEGLFRVECKYQQNGEERSIKLCYRIHPQHMLPVIVPCPAHSAGE